MAGTAPAHASAAAYRQQPPPAGCCTAPCTTAGPRAFGNCRPLQLPPLPVPIATHGCIPGVIRPPALFSVLLSSQCKAPFPALLPPGSRRRTRAIPPRTQQQLIGQRRLHCSSALTSSKHSGCCSCSGAIASSSSSRAPLPVFTAPSAAAPKCPWPSARPSQSRLPFNWMQDPATVPPLQRPLPGTPPTPPGLPTASSAPLRHGCWPHRLHQAMLIGLLSRSVYRGLSPWAQTQPGQQCWRRSRQCGGGEVAVRWRHGLFCFLNQPAARSPTDVRFSHLHNNFGRLEVATAIRHT